MTPNHRIFHLGLKLPLRLRSNEDPPVGSVQENGPGVGTIQEATNLVPIVGRIALERKIHLNLAIAGFRFQLAGSILWDPQCDWPIGIVQVVMDPSQGSLKLHLTV